MYKKNKDQEKRYKTIVLIIVVVVILTVNNKLTKFFNRDDLTEYVQSHQSEVSVMIYLFTAILAFSVGFAALYVR
ncbi:MAG: hypothetical protein LBG15_11325, partial [Dysgonamonadaceae bacterium]|nr:hypothetical protein [Dysgonamonadaceae bacterium]